MKNDMGDRDTDPDMPSLIDPGEDGGLSGGHKVLADGGIPRENVEPPSQDNNMHREQP